MGVIANGGEAAEPYLIQKISRAGQTVYEAETKTTGRLLSEETAEALGGMGFFQPVVAALVGLIPNCAASVLLTQLYVEGALRFSSLVAGLCTGAGVGLAVLWRTNPSWKQNLFITGLTWGAGAFLGVAMQVVVAVFA